MDKERIGTVIFKLAEELCNKEDLTEVEEEFLEVMDEITDTILKR